MKNLLALIVCMGGIIISFAQDLTQGLTINDLSAKPMQNIAKPAYLEAITDPTFGTTIRRISNAGNGGVIVPMYNTIQPWNADESLMIVYNQSSGTHQLLDGRTYAFIRNLSDIRPADIEQIYWDFDNPAVLYYLDGSTYDFIKYTVATQQKESLVNLNTITNNCSGFFSMGNDVQMISWDSDVFGFRCNNDRAYSYRISTGTLTEFAINSLEYTAPMPAPSGNLFYHSRQVYNANGALQTTLNERKVEHSCLGKLSNGNDAYFAIAFAEGPDGGCIGDIIAHDLTTGNCFPLISESQGYDYPQSGTHISALAHKNTEGGWVAASMIGYDQDGQSLLDQELVIVKAEQGNVKVCRIGHHRSDEDQFNYWGEPHACISPTGTRVLFGSDWSGSEDGQSVDCYVVELPAYQNCTLQNATLAKDEDPIPTGVYSAEIITASGRVRQNTAVDFQAANSITLRPGFQAEQGSNFSATIVDCSINALAKTNFDKEAFNDSLRSLDNAPSKQRTVTAIKVNNHPNPFHVTTTIQVQVSTTAELDINLYNKMGQLIKPLAKQGYFEKGLHSFSLDGSNYPTGMYFLMVKSETEQVVHKLTLIN